MDNKKFKLIPSNFTFNGKILYNIMATKTVGDIKKGTVGGFVECASNLSFGNGDASWIYPGSIVCGSSYVYKNTKVDNSIISGNVAIYKSSISNCNIFGNGEIQNDMLYNKLIQVKHYSNESIHNKDILEICLNGNIEKLIFFRKMDKLNIVIPHLNIFCTEDEFLNEINIKIPDENENSKIVAEYIFAKELAKFHFDIKTELVIDCVD